MKTSMQNSVRLTGFLGSDPEIVKFGDNKSLARVSLATSDYYKNKKGDWITETQWHNLVMWGKQAEIAERQLMKGQEIAIEGKLVNRSYEDKNGVLRYVSEVVVNRLTAFPRLSRPVREQLEAAAV